MELFYHRWHAPSAASFSGLPDWQGLESPPQPNRRLVLLHGMGGTGSLWRPLAAALESELEILAPDQRGHGKSQLRTIGSPNGGYTPLEYGQDVVDTLKAVEWHSAWLLGHSMGVRTAVAAAHLQPDRVEGLILIDLGFSGVAGGGLGEGLAQFLKLLPPAFESRQEARAFMSQSCPDPSIAQYLMAVSKLDAQGRVSFPFDHSALIQTIEAAQDSSVRLWVKELGQRNLPILVLRGAQSLVWSHEDFENERAEFAQFPSVVFHEVQGAGHGLPFEQRLELAERVLGFTRSGGSRG